jgi:hypothetical protein
MSKVDNTKHSYKVHLVAQRGVPKAHLEEVALWFQRNPGPITVSPSSRPIELPIGEDGALRWADVFGSLSRLREDMQIPSGDFLYMLTGTPNELNWYAAEDEANMRNGFGHVADFSWATSAPGSVVSAHYITKAVFNALILEAGRDWRMMWHDHPRGCFFDFCNRKEDLNFKLRTADICGDCLQVFREIGLPDDLLHQTVQIMEACRPFALSTGPYRVGEASFSKWPFPVAITKHKVVQASNPLLKFMLLLDHFDSLIRYFYLTREILQQRVPQLEDRPSLGLWVEQLAKSLKGQSSFREVISIAQREQVVALRNETRGHGYMSADTSAYAPEASRLEAIIGEIETEMEPFLFTHRLVLFKKMQLANKVYEVSGEELVGSHLLHPKFKTVLSNPVDAGLSSEGDVYVADMNLTRFQRISPYIQSAQCPTCHHPRILVTDGGNRFIDVYIGHRVNLDAERSTPCN